MTLDGLVVCFTLDVIFAVLVYIALTLRRIEYEVKIKENIDFITPPCTREPD